MIKDFLEKELFNILQELKKDNNCLDISYMQRKLDDIYDERTKVKDDFNFYNKYYFLTNIKIILLSMLPFILKEKKLKCKSNKEKADRILDLIEQKYDSLEIKIIIYESLIDISKVKKNDYEKNINQINNFLDYINDLTVEDKQKIFNYKMGN